MRLCKTLMLGSIGGILYGVIECAWRGHTHWTMILLGGVLFVLLGGLNEWLPWEMRLHVQAVLGAALVTAAELAAGLILNVWLGLGVWDYSALPGNLWGQICPEYAVLWVPLSAAAIVVDDWLRYWIWGEERPHYTL